MAAGVLIAVTWSKSPGMPMPKELDYRFIVNPAYNRDRGPVSVLGFRVHAQY
jgi:high affinity Mn2+ porin